MEITIEIGDEDIQKQIKEELDYLLIIAEAMKPPLNISQVLVPEDFQAKIRELTGEDDYKFQRGVDNAKVTVAAKIIEGKDGTIIVVSPWLYLPVFDTMIRCFILAHEFAHIMNKGRFPKIPKDSFTSENYLGNLYILFDEYTADRLSFLITERLFTSPTEAWEQYTNNWVIEYLNPSSHPTYYEQIKTEIENFREHGNVDLYWKSIFETMHVVSVSIVHGFASYHQHNDKYVSLKIPNTEFINEKTLVLMDYLKEKYENKETDLHDGIGLMSNYLTNFGVKFEDRPGNMGYIYVLDI
ncbi:MAG: hypothetical protein J0L96_17345 [Anaerolineae bacterium]|nr:hypothetical protein [Anaerolineae bacterium]